MNYAKIMEAIKLALSLVPVVEALIPMPKKGKEKLDLILGILTDTLGSIDAILPLITAILNRSVKAANSTGAFKSSPDANTVMN